MATPVQTGGRNKQSICLASFFFDQFIANLFEELLCFCSSKKLFEIGLLVLDKYPGLTATDGLCRTDQCTMLIAFQIKLQEGAVTKV